MKFAVLGQASSYPAALKVTVMLRRQGIACFVEEREIPACAPRIIQVEELKLIEARRLLGQAYPNRP